nr:NIL domain-containing protein [Bombella intestini]
MRLVLSGDSASEPLFSELSAQFGVQAALLQGGVTTVGEHLSGDMILSLEGDRTEQALSHLKMAAQNMEILGYVPSHS